MSSSDSIKVVVRARPHLQLQSEIIPWVIKDECISHQESDGSTNNETYSFDEIFNVEKRNVDVYATAISPIVHEALQGINLTIFAYGATSSGKTYTMIGVQDDPGVIPRIVDEIFKQIENHKRKKFLLRVSYVEIYNEVIIDLLDTNSKDLKIREDFYNCVSYNAQEKVIENTEQCLEIMEFGNVNRTTGETKMNAHSSRSHSIFRITIESTLMDGTVQGPIQTSQINLIDLAGSERASQTGATGQRFKEGAHINRSLTTLGLVIRQLTEKKEHISYRDSKLTRILSNSLGGNAKTVIICNINLLTFDDTNSTLMFAQSAKLVKNKPKVNVIENDKSWMKKYIDIKKQLDVELEKNRELKRESEKNSKKINDLKVMLEQNLVTKSTETVKKVVKRRYTLSSLSSLGSITEEIDERLQTDEQENLSCIRTPEKRHSVAAVYSTPEQNLRTRVDVLKQENDELRMFLLNENKVISDHLEEVIRERDEARNHARKSEKTTRELVKTNEKLEQQNVDNEFILESLKTTFKERERELLELLYQATNKTTPAENISVDDIELKKIQNMNNDLAKEIMKLNREKEELNHEIESMNKALNNVQSELFESQDKLLELSEDFDKVEKKRKSLELEIISLKSNEKKVIENLFKLREILLFDARKIEVESNKNDSFNEIGSLENNSEGYLLKIENLKRESDVYNRNLPNIEINEQDVSTTTEDYQLAKTNKNFQELEMRQICKLKNCEELVVKLKEKHEQEMKKMREKTELIKSEHDNYSNQLVSMKNQIENREKNIDELEKTLIEMKTENVSEESEENMLLKSENRQYAEQVSSLIIQLREREKNVIELKEKLLEVTENKSRKTDENKYSQELEMMKNQLESHEEIVAALRQELLNCETNINEKIEEIKLLKSENDKYLQELDSLKLQLENRNKNISDLKEKLFEFETIREENLDVKIEEIKLLKYENDKYHQELDSVKIQLENRDNDIFDLKEKLSEFEAEKEKNNNEKIEEINVLKSENNKYHQELKNRDNDIIDLKEKLFEFETDRERSINRNIEEIKLLKSENDKYLQELGSVKIQLENRNKNISDLKEKLFEFETNREKNVNEKIEEIKVLKSENNEYLQELDSVKTQLKNRDKNISDLKEKLSEMETIMGKNLDLKIEEIKLLKSENDKYHQELDSVKIQLKNRDNDIFDLKEKLFEFEADRGKNINEKIKEIEFLKSEINKNVLELQLVNMNLENREKTIVEMKQKLHELEMKKGRNLVEDDLLKSENNRIIEELQMVQIQLEKREKSVEELRRKLESVESENEETTVQLKHQIFELEIVKKQLENDLKSKYKIIESLETKIENHAASIEILNKKLEMHRTEKENSITDLKTKSYVEKIRELCENIKKEEQANEKLRENLVELERQLREVKKTDDAKFKSFLHEFTKIFDISETNVDQQIEHILREVKDNLSDKIKLEKEMKANAIKLDHAFNNQVTEFELKFLKMKHEELIAEHEKQEREFTSKLNEIRLKKDEYKAMLDDIRLENQNLIRKNRKLESEQHKVEQGLKQPIREDSNREQKWKSNRTKVHDSRRSIDLDTICKETNDCVSCAMLKQKIQKDMLELNKYVPEYEKLKDKYEVLKKLCRVRGDEIEKLKKQLG